MRNLKNKTKGRLRASALALALTAACGAEELPVEPPPGAFRQFLEQDYLLGDWWGTRTWLKKHGLDFEFIYFAAVPSNLDGGLRHGSAYQGGLMMLMDVHTDPLLGWEGGQLHVSGLSIHNGDAFADTYVGDLNRTSMLDYPDDLRLWELWYEQKLIDSCVAIRFGQLGVDRDFLVTEYYNSLSGISLLNQTFFFPTVAFNIWDQPYFPVGNHGLASTPYSAPGVRLRVDPWESVYAQVGVYAGNPDKGSAGFPRKLGYGEGVLVYAETTVKINGGDDASRPPGNLKVGGYYHTDSFYDMYEGTFAAFENYTGLTGAFTGGQVESRSGNFGLYFLADQMLWREVGPEDKAQQGLAGFARAAVAPEDRNLASWGADGGLVYKGLIPTRDWDTFALGFSWLSISDDLVKAQEDINQLLPLFGFPPAFSETADYEAVFEMSYKAQVTAWSTLQVSLQRVFHPGGRIFHTAPDAWVLTGQAVLRF